MDKILLTGGLDETAGIINENLSGSYNVQLCSRQPEDIKAMVKIVKPGLVIICNAGSSDKGIIEWFKEKHPELPVLAVTTTEGWKECRDYLQGEKYDKLFLPAGKDALTSKCRQMLKKDNRKNTPGNGKKKILIVDDSPLILRNIKSLLDQEYTIALATSGQQALNTILKEEPDLVLLDYEMPKMSGKTVFEMMQKDEDMKDTPVIFLTSVSDKNVICSILQLKPAGYILKPPDTEKLLDTIKKVLKS